MARGNNRGRGSPRGQPFHGRGERGGGRGRGRGRGQGGRSGFGGRGGDTPYLDELDFPVQMRAENGRSNASSGARGRGRGSYRGSGRDSPAIRMDSFRGRGRGEQAPNGGGSLGRGRPTRGQLNSRVRAGASLSKLLYEDRPLLRPITFVRSVYTATLFQQQEDIFQPLSEPVVNDEKSHVPTADQVSRVFGQEQLEPANEAVTGDGEEEQLDEIDFADVGKMQAEVDAIAATMNTRQTSTEVSRSAEETFTGFYVDTTPTPVGAQAADTFMADRMAGALGDDEEVIVYVAPHPRLGRPAGAETITTTSILTGLELSETRMDTDVVAGVPDATSSVVTGLELCEAQQDTNVAVEILNVPSSDTIPPEVPPVLECEAETSVAAGGSETAHSLGVPSSESILTQAALASEDTQQAGVPEPPAFESISFTFKHKTQTRKLFPVGSPRSLLPRSKKARRRQARRLSTFGAMVSEAQVQRVGRERDPREAEQRRGDSDVDFGGLSDDEIEEVSNGLGDMDLDAEAHISLDAMKNFVKSMSAEGSRHVTMDDIADAERMRVEDDEDAVEKESSQGSDGKSSQGEGTAEEEEEIEQAEPDGDGFNQAEEEKAEDEDEELERVLDAEERVLIGEDKNGPEDNDDNESSEADETPRRGFQTRLARIREKGAEGKGKARQMNDSSDDDDGIPIDVTWADEDEDFIAEIEEMLDANAELLSHGDRKARNKLFQAIKDGAFEDDEFATMMTPASRRKDKDIPPELRDQWEKDRQKKAENKRKRREAMLAAAADPLAVHKGGKKGRKAMFAAARLDASIEVKNRVIDFGSLEAQIRGFLFDIGGKNTMTLPPCDKETRRNIHDLAQAFNLKSQSKGKGIGRYTTLIKTSRSGIEINEKKIKRILTTNKNSSWDLSQRGKGKGQPLDKHREGEEVGKAAPKIGESNVGFRMLAGMGWAEGDRIGLSGGLDAPLTAIMKKTKLGLGAIM